MKYYSIAQSILLGKLLSHFRPIPLVSREDAMMYAGGMVLCTLISLVSRNSYELQAFHTGLRVKAACCSIIYRKVMNLILKKLIT